MKRAEGATLVFSCFNSNSGPGAGRFRALLPLVFVLLASGCGKPAFIGARSGEFPMAEKFVYPNEVKDFKVLYNQNCRACHGTDGRGGPAPPLNDALFQAIVPDTELIRVITEGREDTLMTGFAGKGARLSSQANLEGGPLTAEQVEILVRGMREHWGKATITDKEHLPVYLIAESPKGDKEAGVKVFEASCANCHKKGKDGKGLVTDPNFLALISDQALRRIVITGRNDFEKKMPSYKESDHRGDGFMPLTSQEVADVVAYLASLRNKKSE